MDKRDRNYIIFAVIIACMFLGVYLFKVVGANPSKLTNAIMTILFYAPIVSGLFYASGDIRLKKPWKIILRILACYLAIVNILAVILYLIFR